MGSRGESLLESATQDYCCVYNIIILYSLLCSLNDTGRLEVEFCHLRMVLPHAHALGELSLGKCVHADTIALKVVCHFGIADA